MQGKASSLAESFNGVGSMFGPTIGGFLFDIGGFPLPFWASGGFSLLLAVASVFFLDDFEENQDEVDSARDVTWREIVTSPGVPVSTLSIIVAGLAWQWYSPSLEPHLLQTYGLSASNTGLVFTAFGITYSIFSPVAGYLTDKGLDGLVTMIFGNVLIMISFMFIGPIPAFSMIGDSLALTVFCVGMLSYHHDLQSSLALSLSIC